MPPSSQTPDQWESSLTGALETANIPTLLMVLLHLTGDMRWVSDRYQCTRIKGLDDNDSGGLPPEVQAEVRDAARTAILDWKAGQPAVLNAPSHEVLARMMRISTGEDVPEGYGAMLSAGLGLDPEFALDQREAFKAPKGFHVVVIGAGVAGLCAAIRLQGAGIPYTVVEKNAEVGGTWYENRYPGAGVDTPNHIYSYSFAKNDWSRYFALQGEIQAYFEGVADKFKVRDHMRFSTRVESARYDEATARWTVRIAGPDGKTEELQANVLISAVGLLNVPRMPDIQGLDSFEGPCFHSSRWPEGLDIQGKRVAIIGNGASSMQIVPAIADTVKSLTIFQRSKQWAAPFERFKKEVPEPMRFMLREVPYYQEWYRQRLAWVFNDRIHSSLQVDPEWPHPERSINRRNDKHREYFVNYMKEELGDRQDLLPEVLPDYPPFGKRMLMDNGWYRAVAKPQVHMVGDGIREITARGIVTNTGELHEFDVIVVATGFDAINLLSSFQLFGRGGQPIREIWDRQGAEAYMGVATPGFPNFFMLAGPNTALGHGGSVVTLLETQVRYVMGLLKQVMAEHGDAFEIEVRQDLHEAFNEKVQELHGRMIWTHKGMTNWYRNQRGRIVATTPFRNDDYWHMTRKTDLADYQARHVSGQAVSPAPVKDEALQ
jgi:4-hydroxyacetophenone monooxygenase